MPMSMLRLKPGVQIELTPSQLEAGYAVSNLGRFRNGLFEKLGGWVKYFASAVGGVPRALHAWLDLNDNQYLGVGSTTILGAINSSTLTNITPQTYTSDFSPNFTTTLSSTTVTVDDPNIANVTVFDSVYFPTPVSIGGVIVSGLYPIDLVLGTTQYNITVSTPATSATSGGSVPLFNTTSGSSTVLVTLNNHGLAALDRIAFGLSTTVGGVTISGEYQVLATPTPSANQFSIGVTAQATSTTSASMNGGDAEAVYYIALGPAATATGYGIGTYGSGGYGTGSTAGQQTGTPITATNWTLDNWGETLIAVPNGGGIYAWTPNTGFQNAQLISSAPPFNAGAFVSMQTQMLIAFGSTEQHTIGEDQDPLLVKWSDVGDYTSWDVSTTSQAGSRRLPNGSKIVGGMSVPGMELLWTDLDLWAMNYLGSLQAGVWGFTKIGSNCGLIGRHAATRQGSQIYWMSASNFWVTGSGQPVVIPCTVWDSVFQDLNTTYQDKCWAWSNTPFNEIWFFFPRASTSATEPDCYVKYNTREGVWDNTVQPFDRSCGIDQSLLGTPLAASSAGIIYQHEMGYDADGQVINSYFQSGDYQLAEGQEVMFVDWVIPDMKFGTYNGAQTANLQITFFSQYYLGGTTTTYGPFAYTSSTQYLNPRIRGRVVSFKVESGDLGSFWRIGGMRFRIAQDGRL